MAPKTRIVVASVLLLGLGVAASLRGLSASTVARAVLALVAVGSAGVWFLRVRQATSAAPAPRLAVVSRLGLAHRTGVALVEVDGSTFLVVHGDGFAQLRPIAAASQPKVAFERRLRNIL